MLILRLMQVLSVLTLILTGSKRSLADQFHYNNFVVGDRAIGMGGAYGGVSDDASGAFYNPAGLAFALSNDISGSANALYSKKVTYKKAVGGKDFQEQSGGTLPSFFGGLQKLDNIAKGLVFAFGMYTVDGELKDQDDLIENVDLGPGVEAGYNASDSNDRSNYCNVIDTSGNRTSTEGANPLPNSTLQRFHRTVNQRGSTFIMGGAVGWRLSNNFSIGAGANYVTVDELIQEYQDVRIRKAECTTSGDYTELVDQLGQNIRQHLTGAGIQPMLAAQLSLFGRLSLGFTAKFGTYLSQLFDQTRESRRVAISPSDQAAVDQSGTTGGSSYITDFGRVHQSKSIIKLEDNPLGAMPVQFRLGSAYFASTRLLLTFDVTHHTAVQDEEKMKIGSAEISLLSKEAVTNFAAGMEYYVVPAVPLRLGLFTNNDARPDIDPAKPGQRDHIDYYGGTIFAAWVQPNSQIGAGVVLQKGKGEAQKLGDFAIQEVEGQSVTLAFSATHSF